MRSTISLIIACITLFGCIGSEVKDTNPSQKEDHASSSDSDTQQDQPYAEAQENLQGISYLSANEISPTSIGNIEARGMLALLSSAQVNTLINSDSQSPNLGVKSPGIMIPFYIPEGYLIDSVSISNSQYGIFTFYDIKYRHQDNDACFGINHYTYDESNMGDAPVEVDTIEQIEVPGLGISVDVGYIEFDQVKSSGVVTFHLVGNDGIGPYFYHFYSPDDCESTIALEEMRQVVGSFQFLVPESAVSLEDIESFIFSVSEVESSYMKAAMISHR